MKSIKYILMVAVCALFASCMDGDWDTPNFTEAPFGNNKINEENIITIKELISKYPNVSASTDENRLITEDIKIRARVTGNDLGSNLYKQIALQDATGAILVAVNQSGINGYLAVGQEIIVSLKDLYIGGYRKQPEIGAPYNGNSIGRMSKDIWLNHFKIVKNNIDASVIKPTIFTSTEAEKFEENCGKLVTLEGVTFTDADGKATLAPKDGPLVGGNNVHRNLNEFKNVVVRTSTYAKFASVVLPYDNAKKSAKPCNLTGIITRYNNTWQLLIRTADDIKVAE